MSTPDRASLFARSLNLKSALRSIYLRTGKRKRLQTCESLSGWMLMVRLVEMCRRLNILIKTGLVREMPVMGRIGNEIVYGSVVRRIV